jgi:hypothetical protein
LFRPWASEESGPDKSRAELFAGAAKIAVKKIKRIPDALRLKRENKL